MKTRLLMICVIVVGLSSLISLFIIFGNLLEDSTDTNNANNREDLKKVLSSGTSCVSYWGVELSKMWHNQTYDYRNDPIFQECYKALENENNGS